MSNWAFLAGVVVVIIAAAAAGMAASYFWADEPRGGRARLRAEWRNE
jgi:hypothetical protein